MASLCSWCRLGDSDYLDPNRKLSASTSCGHLLCAACSRNLFGKHRSARCPSTGCGATLTAGDFTGESAAEAEFKKECAVRRELSTVLNAAAEDFTAPAEFSAYQEMVESTVAAIVSGTPDEARAARAAVAAYTAANQHAIAGNNARAAERARAAEASLKAAAEARRASAASSEAAFHAARAAADGVRRELRSFASLLEEGAALAPATRATIAARVLDLRRKLVGAREGARRRMMAEGGEAAPPPTALAAAVAAATASPLPVPVPAVFPPALLSEPVGGEVAVSRLTRVQLDLHLYQSGVLRESAVGAAVGEGNAGLLRELFAGLTVR